MMRVLTLMLFLIISSSKLSAQSENHEDYLTLEDNAAWIEYFKKLDTKELQLQAIKEKIYIDSLYVAPRPGVSYSFLSNESRKRLKAIQDSLTKATSDCKILMLLSADNIQTEIDLEKNPESIKLIEELIPQNIKNIQILEGTKAMAIYGSRIAGCAVLVMKAESGKITIPEN